MRRLLLAIPVLAGAACIPARDNLHDPSQFPDVSIEITVDGAETRTGGRGAGWRFDGGASSVKGNSATFAWSLSPGSALPAEANDGAWIPVAEGICQADPCSDAVLDRSTSPMLREILDGIRDFAPFDPEVPEDGVGEATRWIRLVLVDHQGRRKAVTVSFAVVNHAPVVDLGSDLRPSPGGRWWTATVDRNLDGQIDNRDAEPWEIVLRPRVTDPDPGDGDTLFTFARPARWSVAGPLAPSLDSDGDGWVDDGWFDEPGQRTLRVPAPLTPSRNVFSVEIGDVGNVVSGVAGLGRAEVEVEVGTSVWAWDEIAGRLARPAFPVWLDPRQYFAGNYTPLAASPDGTLLTGNGDLLDPGLALLGDLGGSVNAACSDEEGGWWIVRSGALSHVDARLFTDVQLPAGAPEGPGTFSSVVSIPRSSDVWTLGSTGADAELLRVSRTGTVVARVPAEPGAAPLETAALLAAGPDGSAWVAGSIGAFPYTAVYLLHLDVDGIVLESWTVQELTAPVALSIDPRSGAAWLGGYHSGTSTYALARVAPDGTLEVAPSQVAAILADPLDGSALILDPLSQRSAGCSPTSRLLPSRRSSSP